MKSDRKCTRNLKKNVAHLLAGTDCPFDAIANFFACFTEHTANILGRKCVGINVNVVAL